MDKSGQPPSSEAQTSGMQAPENPARDGRELPTAAVENVKPQPDEPAEAKPPANEDDGSGSRPRPDAPAPVQPQATPEAPAHKGSENSAPAAGPAAQAPQQAAQTSQTTQTSQAAISQTPQTPQGPYAAAAQQGPQTQAAQATQTPQPAQPSQHPQQAPQIAEGDARRDGAQAAAHVLPELAQAESGNGFKLPSISKGYPLPGFGEDGHFQNTEQLPRLSETDLGARRAGAGFSSQPYVQLPRVPRFQQSQPATPQPPQSPAPAQHPPQPAHQPQQAHQTHQPQQVHQQAHQPPQQPQQQAHQPPQQPQQQPQQHPPPPPQAHQQQQMQLSPQAHQQQMGSQPHTPQQMVMGYMPMYQYGHQFQQHPQMHLGYLPQQQQPQQQQPQQQQPQPPPQPQQAPAAQALSESQANDYRPLNVKDALSYLEQVKLHFSNQPDVYNHFLDIMKDFKSHNIDTPGVIDRVSSLFRGHANLIQGFNTFLPAGYSIRCSLDPNDPNPVRVLTPMGSQTLPHMLTQRQQHAPAGPPAIQPASVQQQVQHAQQLHMQRQQTHANAHLHVQQQQVPYGYGPVPAQPPLLQQTSPAPEQRQGPVEFGHAISYVNKIKNHFSNQPEIYKQFLEILQTYQREQLRISEVYAQVRQLFKEAPDLLEGFKNFLPDTTAGADEGDVQLPPVGSFGPASAAGGGAPVAPQPGSAAGRDGGGSAGPAPDAGASKAGAAAVASLAHGAQAPTSSLRRSRDAPSFVPAAKPLAALGRNNLGDEIAFFDKVKKLLPKSAYHEFLKTLNLFTQQIIDVPALVAEVEPFLSPQPELLQWFKAFVGFEGEPLHIENILQRKHLVDLSQCRSYGRSYRLLPKTEKYMPCSGRDELGYEVFNDEWVGYPTWASEDSGFVAHRKNQYEEIMFRVEEERHEYDHYIGANQRTIQVLEAIANRMAAMTAAEVAAFRLPEGLGHGTKIYQKVIRKIYDKKNGEEVISALHDNPGAALPVVLRRLKQKDEEWRRAHREWNKVWREAERKAFYKSLDHLGLTFKQADRKQLTPRALLAEIMAVKAEQTAKRRLATTNLPPLPTPKSQLDFVVSDYAVVADLKGLIVKYIDFRPTMSAHDKSVCKRFLGVFVDEFFAEHAISAQGLPAVFGRGARADAQANAESNAESNAGANVEANAEATAEANAEATTETNAQTNTQTNGDADGDVEMTDRPRGTGPRDADADAADDAAEELAGQPSWLKLERTSPPLSERPTPRSHYNLFGSTAVYLFMRIFEIIYARLAEVKAFEGVVSKTLAESRRTPFAVELGLYDTRLESMSLQFSEHDVYGQTLALCHRLLEDDVEGQWFEEALRQAYRNRAFKLYTIDKALQSLVKQLHAIVTDDGTVSALLAWESDRALPKTDVRAQIELRMRAKQALSGVDVAAGLSADSYGAAESAEPLFRISWTPGDHKLTFQSLDPFDITLKGAMDDQQRWEYYVTSYMMSLPTEGVPLDQIRAPVLQRNLPEEGHGYKFEMLAEDLQARIAFNSYKLFFEPGTADYLLNVGSRPGSDHAKQLRSRRWTEVLNTAEEALHEAEAEAKEAKEAESPSDQARSESEATPADDPEAPEARDRPAPTALMRAAQPRLELQAVSVVLPRQM